MTPALHAGVVGAAEDGQRADVVVAGWLGEPRGRTQKRLGAGEVRLDAEDGPAVAKSQRLHAGQRVVVVRPAAPTPVEPAPPVPVRYRDEHLVVIAKPAGLVVHRGAGTRPGATLVDVLVAMGVPLAPTDDASRPGIVHRLDRGTSGLLVVASSPAAREGLVEMFRRHDVERRYTAIVDGLPAPASATVDAPIARAVNNRTRFVVDAAGRPAVSHYDVVDSGPGAAVVTVRLETGRTHQVRVHMAAVGHPVSGDVTYGADRAVAARLGLGRPALHAAHLGFAHPVTGAALTFDEPLPDDLEHACRELLGGP